MVATDSLELGDCTSISADRAVAASLRRIPLLMETTTQLISRRKLTLDSLVDPGVPGRRVLSKICLRTTGVGTRNRISAFIALPYLPHSWPMPAWPMVIFMTFFRDFPQEDTGCQTLPHCRIWRSQKFGVYCNNCMVSIKWSNVIVIVWQVERPISKQK